MEIQNSWESNPIIVISLFNSRNKTLSYIPNKIL